MLFEVDLYPRAGQPDRLAADVTFAARDLGIAENLQVAAARGFLLSGELSAADVDRATQLLLCDAVVEAPNIALPGDDVLQQPPQDSNAAQLFKDATPTLVNVLHKPGVMDPVAGSTAQALRDLGLVIEDVRTLRKYWISGVDESALEQLCRRVLANDAIEQVKIGPLQIDRLDIGQPYDFELVSVPIRNLSDDELMQLSRSGQLYLSLAEMQTIQQRFRELDREPTDIELETIAQTWSEHCSHKTLKGRIAYRDERAERNFQNMLKETIFATTQEIRRRLGKDDWCVSVFEDNAGVVKFDDQHHVTFKVETHNHPSALEPYGGANTGLGGVIRDTLGTGLGAKPVCSTDVFCFAPPDTPADQLPQGVLHPKRVMQGVVSGVRDYGNRMGIPTVNGAICFDPRYIGNPLVYCGNVGLLPHDMAFGEAQEGDLIVAVGGRTGRDGIHGATFSSAELTSESEELSGGAVQIGNAITEKMVADVVLQARDQGLFTAITDCGAGGFSSAVGEMGEKIGAEVNLEQAPLKYAGLSYTEIWISEAQERMVLAVPEENWAALAQLCASESVEATVIGRFVPSGKLTLRYEGETVGELDMQFLHDGRPPVVREAHYQPTTPDAVTFASPNGTDQTQTLLDILGSLNVASKECVIRQYDHEVQAGSVIKPLVGVADDGPGDAAVVRPVISSQRGIVIGCGINPHYGDFDTYDMAASAIDEAVRNCVAVGADPERIALLDNFCWGNTDRPEQLGSLVRAAIACQEVALELGCPFISGKDSLNNEFRYEDGDGNQQSIIIPPTLLISAIGQIADARRAVTMDLKQPESLLYLVGLTRNELGGSHYSLVTNGSGGIAPTVDAKAAHRTFARVHAAINAGLIRACHDLSEGGLAVAAAEMAFAGGCGAKLSLASVANNSADWEEAAIAHAETILLFSESNTRFLCEVRREHAAEFEQALAGVPHTLVGETQASPQVQIHGLRDGELKSEPDYDARLVIDANLPDLKAAWQSPLKW